MEVKRATALRASPSGRKVFENAVNIKVTPTGKRENRGGAIWIEAKLSHTIWVRSDRVTETPEPPSEVTAPTPPVQPIDDVQTDGLVVAPGQNTAPVAPVVPVVPVAPVQPPPVVAPPPVTPSPAEPPRPAPDVTGSFRLGLNVLSNYELARQEAQRGCNFFLLMNKFHQAMALKIEFPKAIVMVRRYFDHGYVPTIEQIMNGLEGATHGALVYTALNEADQLGQGGEDLRRRARLDVEVARRIKQVNPNARFAAGTFSMGTPDFTSEEVCQIIREEYAPHYNSGLLAFDMHLYTPNMQHIHQADQQIWFTRRWEFLFTRCGFDPSIRAIYCSETGLDEAGVGGFRSHGVDGAWVRDWARRYTLFQNQPLRMDGKAYQSPILGGAIFQLGGNGDPKWDGYDVAPYLDSIRQFYGGR